MWNPLGINLLSKDYNGAVVVSLLQSLTRELQNMQREIDELRKRIEEK